MRLWRLIPFILVVGGGVSVASLLSRSPVHDTQDSFTGTLSAIDSMSLSVRPDEGSVMTFLVDDPATLPPGLVAGARVTVRYDTRDSGGRRLLHVALASSDAPAPGAATPETGSLEPAPQASPTAAPASEMSAAVPAATALPASLQPREADRREPPQRGPLHTAALALLVVTGAFLVISSWR
jgi:hypothetical protein